MVADVIINLWGNGVKELGGPTVFMALETSLLFLFLFCSVGIL
jgi:hypothetical protein